MPKHTNFSSQKSYRLVGRRWASWSTAALVPSGQHGHPAAWSGKSRGSSPSQHIVATWSAHDLYWKCVRPIVPVSSPYSTLWGPNGAE